MNRLRELRKKCGYTQEELGRLLGVQKAAVCKYENGRCSIPQEILLKLCDILGVSADYLLCRSNEDFSVSVLQDLAVDMPVINSTAVPVVGRVHAGLPILADENITEYISVPENTLTSGEYFFMDVEGDCMIGEHILPGSRVLVRKQARVENGQIAVVRLGDEVLLRRVKWMQQHLILIPSNPQYEPLVVAGGDVEIVGRAMEVRIDLR